MLDDKCLPAMDVASAFEGLESHLDGLHGEARMPDTKCQDPGWAMCSRGVDLATTRQQLAKKAPQILAKSGNVRDLIALQSTSDQGVRCPKGVWVDQPPSSTPGPKDQYNFTDPESRIMKAGNGQYFEQSYNAPAAVDADGSMLGLGVHVSDQANDKEQLFPTVESVTPQIGPIGQVACDSGFYSQKQIAMVEISGATEVYCATGRQGHHRSLADLAPHQEPPPLGPAPLRSRRWRTG